MNYTDQLGNEAQAIFHVLRAERGPNSRCENFYFPLILKEQSQYEQGKAFVCKMFGGMSSFILHFAGTPIQRVPSLMRYNELQTIFRIIFRKYYQMHCPQIFNMLSYIYNSI